ncbi:type I DNA topoisomerase, partial [Candidatus Berkelbacteria bacterium CG_4_9_14_3_um_filter_39_23]
EPKYVITPSRRKTVKDIKEIAEQAEIVYLATDLDREGEAISWHIMQAAGLQSQTSNLKSQNHKQKQKVYRITFHEITKSAILDALKNPRALNMDLVDAQQARRVLDRLVGYKLSPFLWRKVMKGLSAGRVQSVAVRLVVEREEEIEKFKPDEYWEILASLKNKKDQEFPAKLVSKDSKTIDKLQIKSEKDAKEIEDELENEKYQVAGIVSEAVEKYSFPPYTTSTFQQDVTYKLGFSAKRAMRLAQDLYEAGKITYMRTDSVNLAWIAINSIRKYIGEQIGKDYLPEKPRGFKTKTKGAQEAHEAIRPTFVGTVHSDLKNKKFTEDHFKIYDLIWKRAVASQMKPAILDTQKIDIIAGKYGFSASAQQIKFDGFTKVYPVKFGEQEMAEVEKDEILALQKLNKSQHFTKPSARYNQASLIKKLEELGIGRPSTYASIVDTIQQRGYVNFQNRYFMPTDTGRIVNKMLVDNFSNIVDYKFTAKMENDLDDVADGKLPWQKAVGDFYVPFEKNLKEKEEKVQKQEIEIEGDGEPCSKCGKPMAVKTGKFGKFLACTGYPDCKTTKNIQQKIGIKCPDCKDGDVIERRSKKGKMFYGCSRYPDCKFVSWTRPAPPKVEK